MLVCAKCKKHACEWMKFDEMPSGCPSRSPTVAEASEEYLKEDIFAFGKVCSENSMSREGPEPRVLEIISVAKRCGYHKLGLAFCMGFAQEAEILTRILEYHGFQVESIVCKVGGVDKSLHGIENGGNAMCNPIAQARLLNEQKTDLNIALGLCVGHDSLFFRSSEAPVTVLVAKDKVLGHNPAAALYLSEGYYKNKLYPQKKHNRQEQMISYRLI